MQTMVVVFFKQQIINNLLQQHNKCLLFISFAKKIRALFLHEGFIFFYFIALFALFVSL